MRDRREIESMIARIEADARYGYPPADPFVNSPLALIQVELKSQVAALRWAAGMDDEMATSATAAKKVGRRYRRAITDGRASFSGLANECASIGCLNEKDLTQVEPTFCHKHQSRPQPKRGRKRS